MTGGAGSRRFAALMVAGIVDSLCLSIAWTVVIVQVNARHGLAASGLCGAAMMLGIALSAPVATMWARRLDGRRLLRSAALVEVSLRLAVFLLLFIDAPVWVLAVAVCAMNVVAWTGYAGMRAEVAAERPGSAALTWYATMVASVEAAGVAVVAWLPGVDHLGPDPVQVGVLAVYLLALAPTALVAGGSTVPRAERATSSPGRRSRLRPKVTRPVLCGTILMFLASAPTLLAVALTVELHGRSALGPAAIAFTVGSLAAPTVNGWLEQRQLNGPFAWVLCAIGMTGLWVLAAESVALLCVAQLLSGLCMTALEGLLDATVARQNPAAVTGALARATAGRALGSAAGTALLPLFVVGVGLEQTTGTLTVVLGVVALVIALAVRRPAPVVVASTTAMLGATPEEAVTRAA
jgi:hypothetical protein